MFKKTHNKIRLFVLRNKEPYRVFCDMLGFCPNDISLFQQACRHRSAVRNNYEHNHNERLEFLGDTVLSTIVSDILYKSYGTKQEGFLSKTRSKIVQRETLNQVALSMGLDKLVEKSPHSLSHNNYTYGNALEALIGAIYLDQGFDRCKEIVTKQIVERYIDIEQISRQEINFKSRLIEWCQHHHLPYEFDIDNIAADENKNPIFHARITIVDVLTGEGEGYSKKEAQQHAAQKSIRYIKNHKNFALTLQERLAQGTARQDDSVGE